MQVNGKYDAYEILRKKLPHIEEIEKDIFYLKFLSLELERKKDKIPKTIDFMIAMIARNPLLWKKPKDYFNLFVIGSFRSDSKIIWDISKLLAEFYLELKILPVICPIKKKMFLMHSKQILSRLRRGVRVYDKLCIARKEKI